MTGQLLKVEGAGNDFLLGTGLWAARLAGEPELVARLCRRRRGLGADGTLALRVSAADTVTVVYRNADGSPASFCANGTRCAARVAHEVLGLPARLRVETGWGAIPAEVDGETVTLVLPPPGRAPEPVRVEAHDRSWDGWLAEVGVPQLVVACDDVPGLDLQEIAPLLRGHSSLGPEGANVSFTQAVGEGTLCVRSWERGVEAETLSCGSGIVAAALAWMAELGRAALRCETASGDELSVVAVGEPPDCATRLTGPTRLVARIDRVFDEPAAAG